MTQTIRKKQCANKPHECNTCGLLIFPGEHYINTHYITGYGYNLRHTYRYDCLRCVSPDPEAPRPDTPKVKADQRTFFDEIYGGSK